jgi:two-component SAPR family response regulator
MNKSSLTDETGKILKESYDYFDKHNLIYNKVQAGFHYADFLFKKDKIIEVKKYLEEVFHIIAEKEYVAIIIPEIFTDRAIFDFAIENDINKQFIQQVLVSAVGIKNILWLSEHNKKRITEAVEKLYDIKLECLGGLNIRLRGELISDDKWIRKVRKLIFAYIMLNYKKNITKDNIIELFYPESAPENADNIFHQTISNIRSAIKPSSSEKHPPTYLNYSEKMFQFNPYYFYNIDAYEFEDLFKKITARTTQKSDKKPLLMRAIEIYKGPFLEGYYQDWVEKLREKYSEMFITLLEELIELMKEEGNYQEVIACCEKLLSVDNLNEDVYVNIIESHLRLGNKPAARKVNRQLTAAMKKEFDSPPSKETLKKIETLFSQ